MMPAIVVGQGNQPVLVQKEVPSAKEGFVHVAVEASALNHRDVWITKGLYPGIREGAVMGSDASGTFNGRPVIINPGLDWGNRTAVQDSSFRVLGVPDDGTFAGLLSIPRESIADKPAHLTASEAAALPLAGLTAYRALLHRASAKPGERVLVTGIGGGVALMAMQFAIAMGCEVSVTSSDPAKLERALSMGAKHGFLYSDEDWHQQCLHTTGGVDVIIDGACGPGFSGLIKCLLPGGRLSFYGATAGAVGSLNPQVLFWKQISLLGSTMGSPDDFRDMVDFVTLHRIVPVVDSVWSLRDYKEAFSRMATGRQFGKIVFDHHL